MIYSATPIPGAFVIDLEPRRDHRGLFARAWCRADGAARGLNMDFVQSNIGVSPQRGTLRGLHYQAVPHAECKLVRCTAGAVFDVVVDLRVGSPTRGRWVGIELSADNRRAAFLPEGTAHGYLTLTDNAEVVYETTRAYAADAARGVRFDDPSFGIVWPTPILVVSEADRKWPDYGG